MPNFASAATQLPGGQIDPDRRETPFLRREQERAIAEADIEPDAIGRILRATRSTMKAEIVRFCSSMFQPGSWCGLALLKISSCVCGAK